MSIRWQSLSVLFRDDLQFSPQPVSTLNKTGEKNGPKTAGFFSYMMLFKYPLFTL